MGSFYICSSEISLSEFSGVTPPIPLSRADGWVFFRSLGELLASNHTVTVVQDNVVSTSLLDLLDPSYPLGRVLFSRSPKVLGPHALFATEVTHPSLLTINCVGGKLCNIL